MRRLSLTVAAALAAALAAAAAAGASLDAAALRAGDLPGLQRIGRDTQRLPYAQEAPREELLLHFTGDGSPGTVEDDVMRFVSAARAKAVFDGFSAQIAQPGILDQVRRSIPASRIALLRRRALAGAGQAVELSYRYTPLAQPGTNVEETVLLLRRGALVQRLTVTSGVGARLDPGLGRRLALLLGARMRSA